MAHNKMQILLTKSVIEILFEEKLRKKYVILKSDNEITSKKAVI